ncbi:hypothetical protein BH24DEI1_BH24DEI1_17000 [soil metagenome]
MLDNFEHLMEGAAVASHLLAACPNLDLLVTSRERLNLEEEWLFPIGGLAFPDHKTPIADALAFDAVKLFAQRAKRVAPTFTLTEKDLPHVLGICRLVGGFPLGIELAAVWVRMMPLAEIAAELEVNLDFLASTSRNASERQQSIRTVFEGSWRLLAPKEQEALRKLSVCACYNARSVT